MRYHDLCEWFDKVAAWAVKQMGSATAFAAAITFVIVWIVSGPLFGFSDTWQLIINTSTTIITFLMVFLLQHSQNKDSRAIHAKLNEMIASAEGASNRLINLEELSDDEIEHIHRRFQKLFREAKRLRPGRRTTVEVEADDEE